MLAGIDTHKDTLAVAVIDDVGRPVTVTELANTEVGFDALEQLLEEHAVRRVGIEGSGNYGRAYTQAGAREWGGRMQDDLTDATRWAIDQGIADGARICIYGASYGAYAALMGVAVT